MADVRTIADHSGARVVRSHWRTYLSLLHTLTGSARVVTRAQLGVLERDDVERVLERWTKRLFEISRLTLVAHGVDNAERARPCVILSHHVSLLDIPCVVASFPGSVRFVSKIELRQVPVFGKAMEAAGVIFVDRHNRQQAIEELKRSRRLFIEGYSVWIAAQGTRSRDGRLHAFKKGAFHIALDLDVPILPMWIEGTLDVIPPDQWRSTTGQTVTVAYGEPVSTAGAEVKDIPDLMATVRKRMLDLAKLCGARPDIDAGA